MSELEEMIEGTISEFSPGPDDEYMESCLRAIVSLAKSEQIEADARVCIDAAALWGTINNHDQRQQAIGAKRCADSLRSHGKAAQKEPSKRQRVPDPTRSPGQGCP